MAQRRITDAAEHRNPRLMLKKRAATYAARRHRPRLDPHHPLAWAARSGPRPAAVRADHGAVVSGAPRLARRPTCSRPGSRAGSGCRCAGCRRRAGAASPPCASSARAGRSTWCARVTRSRRCRSRASPTGGSASRAASSPECLADELRRLDPDDAYEDALLHGLERPPAGRGSRPPRRPSAGKAPDPAESRRIAPPGCAATSRRQGGAPR